LSDGSPVLYACLAVGTPPQVICLGPERGAVLEDAFEMIDKVAFYTERFWHSILEVLPLEAARGRGAVWARTGKPL